MSKIVYTLKVETEFSPEELDEKMGAFVSLLSRTLDKSGPHKVSLERVSTVAEIDKGQVG